MGPGNLLCSLQPASDIEKARGGSTKPVKANLHDDGLLSPRTAPASECIEVLLLGNRVSLRRFSVEKRECGVPPWPRGFKAKSVSSYLL